MENNWLGGAVTHKKKGWALSKHTLLSFKAFANHLFWTSDLEHVSANPGFPLSGASSNHIKDILVITNQFTKYAVAVPTLNQKTQTVAKCLWDHFFVHYGIPEKIHSDQGPGFKSQIIRELCKLIGTQKVRTTPALSSEKEPC